MLHDKLLFKTPWDTYQAEPLSRTLILRCLTKRKKEANFLRWQMAADMTGCRENFSPTISLICLRDLWRNPSTSDHASWKTYQLLTIAGDEHVQNRGPIERKLASSTPSFYPHIPHVALIGSHFSKSLIAPSLIAHISIFSPRCPVYLCSSGPLSPSLPFFIPLCVNTYALK